MTELEPAAEATLRERKKARTRLEISDVATRLFAQHGFEEVTLSQIAAAAEVSTKTIFNYFGSKEELYFDRADELRDAIVSTLVDRDPGVTTLAALHTLLRENLVPFPGTGWNGMNDADARARFRSFMGTQDRSPALRARRLVIGQELGGALAETLAGELGLRRGDPDLLALAAMLVAAFEARDGVLRAGVGDDLSPRALRRKVVAVVDALFLRLTAAFGDLDRPRA